MTGMTDEIMEILAKRGIDAEVADRYGLSSAPRGGGSALVIPFVRNGEVVRRKYRRFDRDEDKWSQDKGGIRCAFNEDCLRDASLLSVPLIITEGELDAIAALQAGFQRTISVPDGAPPPGERDKGELLGSAKYDWLKEIWSLLSKDHVSEFILATDDDEPGAALMQDLSVILGRARCKFLVYPKCRKDRGRARCKDLNEVLEDYGEKGVVETLNRAQWLKVDGVYKMSELPPAGRMEIFESPAHRLFNENFKCRMGDFSVWTGTPGFGKTTFVNDYFCSIANQHGLKIAWASFEQSPVIDHKRNLRAWFCGVPDFRAEECERAAADRWIDRHHIFMVPDEDDDATLEWIVEKMEAAVMRHGAKIVVIDPWNEIEHCRRREESETEYIGRAIRLLKRFAKSFRVHVAVVAHPTKSVKDGDGNYKMPTLYDISGSAHWYNKPDLGVIIHRENEDDTMIKVQKSRYHDIIGKPGEVRMQFSLDERKFKESERIA